MAIDYDVKDIGLANQGLDKIDKNVAPLKLQCLNVKIDKLMTEQKKYFASWEMGT